MERGDHVVTAGRATATFYAPDLTPEVEHLTLGASAAHHARVRRLASGDAVRLSSGTGVLGAGTITRAGSDALEVRLERVERVARRADLRLYVPVADGDRTLWLAEKATELGVARWQPVLFQRSRSVASRGEGDAFTRKVQARMIAALEQSGGAWLPELHPASTVESAAEADRDAVRLLLDAGGAPLLSRAPHTPEVAIVLGPEGGLEPSEHAALTGAGWLPVTVAANTLRFETAGVAAVAIVHAAIMCAGHIAEV